MLDFNGKNIAKIAVFTALSFVVSIFEFPIFAQAPFLKLDFSNVFVLIGGFSLGPIHGVIILFVKEILCLIKTSNYIGQIANFIIGCSYVLLPTIVYYYKKGLKSVALTLSIASIIQVGVGLVVNRFINFPLFGYPISAFYELALIISAFNLIKGVAVAIVTIILYKRIKKFLHI